MVERAACNSASWLHRKQSLSQASQGRSLNTSKRLSPPKTLNSDYWGTPRKMKESSPFFHYLATNFNVKSHREIVIIPNCTHHHLKMQQTERKQRETWVRGCPHDLLRWEQRLKPEAITATLQASHRRLWDVCVECVCSAENSLIWAAYREPLICKWADLWQASRTHSCSHLLTRTQAFPEERMSGDWARHDRDWLRCLSFHLLIQKRGPFTCV